MHALAHRYILIFQCIVTMCSSSQMKCQMKSQAGTAGMNAVNSTNRIKSLRTPVLTRACDMIVFFCGNLIVYSCLFSSGASWTSW